LTAASLMQARYSAWYCVGLFARPMAVAALLDKMIGPCLHGPTAGSP
jgi:hypothetical protein